MLHHRLAWYIGGLVLGLCVVVVRGLLNEHLGVTGGWLVMGLILGAALFALIAGGPDFHGYGWLTDTFHGAGRIVGAALLLVSGVLIGFGAKTAAAARGGQPAVRSAGGFPTPARVRSPRSSARASPGASSPSPA